MSKSLKAWIRCAVIAALYAALTFIIPWSSGLIQLRVSEALCVLPFYMPEATAGLFIGCLIGNLLAGCIPIDIAFGSLATLVAALVTAYIAKKGGSKWLLPLPSVVINALVVGAVLCYGYGVGVPYYLCATYVFIGQALSCYGLGMPLFFALKKLPANLYKG